MSEGDMPCGECGVCGDQLDHSKAGFCEVCGNGFHWSRCGEWRGSKHMCSTCQCQAQDEEDLRELPALSIRQPWAWLIVHGTKRFENRDWSTKNHGRHFRGRFLIHAAKGMTKDEYAAGHAVAEEHGVVLPAFEFLQRGGIIGSAEAVAWHDAAPDMPYAFGSGFELADVRPLPFMACKGALGFFKPVIELPRKEVE